MIKLNPGSLLVSSIDYASSPCETRLGATLSGFVFYVQSLYTTMSGEIRYTSECGACGPAVQARASCTGELGDEWSYDGYGSCNDCQFNCVSFGLLGNACTVGTRAKCKHVSYLGDKTACCLGRGSGDPKKTCNPTYNISNPACDGAYIDYCKVNDRILKDPICQNWRNVRPDQSKVILKAYCAAHLDAPECKTWCSTRTDGTCDDIAVAWCKEHPADPFCSCISSPLTDVKFGINPKCVDRKCIDTGYITSNMRTTACPDITNCEVQSLLENSGVQLAGVTINQQCGSGASASVNTSEASPLSPPTALPTFSTDIYLIMFFLVLAVLIAVIFAVPWSRM